MFKTAQFVWTCRNICTRTNKNEHCPANQNAIWTGRPVTSHLVTGIRDKSTSKRGEWTNHADHCRHFCRALAPFVDWCSGKASCFSRQRQPPQRAAWTTTSATRRTATTAATTTRPALLVVRPCVWLGHLNWFRKRHFSVFLNVSLDWEQLQDSELVSCLSVFIHFC